MGKGWVLLAAVAAMLVVASAALAADCTNPSKPEGSMVYNSDYHTMQFCNGTNWIAMGGVWNVPWQASGTAVYYNGGNVGIGTASPGTTLEVAGTTTLQQQAWQTPTLQNSWVNYGLGYSTVGYFKDSQGVVHIRGLVKTGSCGYAIFTLPAGYRPGYRSIFIGVAHNGNELSARTDVQTDGQVVAGGYLGGLSCGATFYSLEGISFRAEN